MHFSGTGHSLLSISSSTFGDGTSRLWDTASGKELHQLQEPEARIFDSRFSQDEQEIITAAYLTKEPEDDTEKDVNRFVISRWSTNHGRHLDRRQLETTADYYETYTDTTLSPHGNWLACSIQRDVVLWDLRQTSSPRILTRNEKTTWSSVTFDRDETRIAYAKDQRTLCIDSLSTSERECTLGTHNGDIKSVQFHPNGKRVATGSKDGYVRVWDIATRECVASLKHDETVEQLAFNADGRLLATADSNGTLICWDLTTGDTRCKINDWTARNIHASSLSLSPDGETLTASAYEFRGIGTRAFNHFWSWSTKEGQRQDILRGFRENVGSLTFSPNGELLAAGSQAGEIRVFANLYRTPKHRQIHPPDSRRSVAQFNPDGESIALGERTLFGRRSQIVDGHNLLPLFSPEKDGQYISFSQQGKWITFDDRPFKAGSMRATASRPEPYIIRLVEAHSGEKGPEFHGHQKTIRYVSFNHDDSRLASTSDDCTARIWRLDFPENSLVLQGHEDIVWSAVFSPDGRMVLTASEDGTARLWESTSGQPIAVLRGEIDALDEAVFNCDGRRILLIPSHSKAGVELWDAMLRSRVALLPGRIVKAIFSPDGNRVITGHEDGITQVWDAETGASLLRFDQSPQSIDALAMSRDGERILTGSADGSVYLWNAGTGRELLKLGQFSGSVTSVAFSPDGNRILASTDNGEMSLWDCSSATVQAERFRAWRSQPESVQPLIKSLSKSESLTAILPELWRQTDLTSSQKRAAVFLAMNNKRQRLLSILRSCYASDADFEKAFPQQRGIRTEVNLDDFFFGKVVFWIPSPDDMNAAAWAHVNLPRKTPAEYAAALEAARAADEMAPGNSACLNTLGLAYYRNGEFERAIQTLEQSEARLWKDGYIASNHLFIAMSRYRLGKIDDAREIVAKVKSLKEPLNAEDTGFLAEAEALLASE